MLKRFKQEYKSLSEVDGYTVYDPNSSFYDYLQDKELLPKENPRRDEFMEQAEANLKAQWGKSLKGANAAMKESIRQWMDDVKGTLDKKPKAKRQFYAAVKLLILTDYMQTHIVEESEFNEIINN